MFGNTLALARAPYFRGLALIALTLLGVILIARTAQATPTVCPGERFSDVCPTDWFYTPVLALTGNGVLSGYSDGTFRPYAATTRGQMLKIVVIGLSLPVPPLPPIPSFVDVPATHPFAPWIEAGTGQGLVTGYDCGGPGEPCPGRYFRPNLSVTRGQLARILVRATGWTPLVPSAATYADVPPSHPFYGDVERLTAEGIIEGYGCGSPGEQCDPQSRPYYRVGASVTRAQTAKMIYTIWQRQQGTPAPPTRTPGPPPDQVRFAVVGDYGNQSAAAVAVATMIAGWDVNFIVTTGDNNYQNGAAGTIDGNIGRLYHNYIYPYVGSYGPGATYNRFWPALGNHDWYCSTCPVPYTDYFVLPGNERYYTARHGPVQVFMLDSDSNEPDGITSTSVQAAWLQGALAQSTAPWKVVTLHHPPYSSGSRHGSSPALQWPYAAWGADVVLAGHDHIYERLLEGGLTYFVNGVGGAGLYSCGTPLPGSQVCFNSAQGAQLVEATGATLRLQFLTYTGYVVDDYTLTMNNEPKRPAPADLGGHNP